LGHEGDEFAVGGKMREIGESESFVADLAAKFLQLLVRALEEFFEEAEFVHQLQSGRMDGVAAKVAEEIGVFFEDEDFDAGTGEEETEHHAGGSASDYAATGLGEIGWHGLIFLNGGPEEKGNVSRRGRRPISKDAFVGLLRKSTATSGSAT
jgi:hypothetical protein